MRIGVVFPQTELGNDPAAIRDYAQTVDQLGYTHILAYDHVLGANPNRPGGWSGPYTYKTPFYEPFVLFSFLAGITRNMEFATGIIILPQRQTALVAKQAATLDVLCDGRLRVGIGIGWNQVEYEALNENFNNRGKRVEEQVTLLKQLWTQPLVNFEGKYHTVADAGINPLPVQRPIPIWFGGHVDAVMKRVAYLGNGWMPNYRKAADASASLAALDRYLKEAGRSRAEIGLEARLNFGAGNPDEWHVIADGWQKVGATHLSINTMGCGFGKPDQHMAALRTFAQAML